jgi:hypothetical protein
VPPQPSTEPLREFLPRRKRELTQQISALQGQIIPKQRELEEVTKAMQALGLEQPGNELARLLASAAPDGLNVAAIGLLHNMSSNALLEGKPPNFDQTMTIKQMIVYALRDHFHNGATPAELRDYIRTAYGREVDRNSISPQLTRLRDEHRVEQQVGLLNEGKWWLTAIGRQYDHPRSIEKE